MFNGSEIRRHVLWVLFPITQLLNEKRQTDPSGGHSMKRLTRTLESVMKDKKRWWSCQSDADEGDKITKYTVEAWMGSWNRKKTQYINGKNGEI